LNPIFVKASAKIKTIIAFDVHKDFSCSVKLAITIDRGESRKRKVASVFSGDKKGIRIPRLRAKNNITKVKRVLLALNIIRLKRLKVAQNTKVTSKAAESTKNTSLKAEKSKLILGNNLFKNFISL
jgi:hypothetical protein